MQIGIVDAICRGAAAMGHVGLGDLFWAFLMWTVMMVATMLPTAVPATLLFTALSERRSSRAKAGSLEIFYVAGYLAAWMAYSAPAALAQWSLLRLQMLSPMAMSANRILSVAVLVAAGLFQFSSLKEACLSKCRTPLAFFLAEWRDGAHGAFVVGLRHGGYCVACCWALMAVMFVVGTMNVVWMGILTIFVLGEKLAPRSWRVSQASGVVLLAWAAWVGFGALLPN